MNNEATNAKINASTENIAKALDTLFSIEKSSVEITPMRQHMSVHMTQNSFAKLGIFALENGFNMGSDYRLIGMVGKPKYPARLNIQLSARLVNRILEEKPASARTSSGKTYRTTKIMGLPAQNGDDIIMGTSWDSWAHGCAYAFKPTQERAENDVIIQFAVFPDADLQTFSPELQSAGKLLMSDGSSTRIYAASYERIYASEKPKFSNFAEEALPEKAYQVALQEWNAKCSKKNSAICYQVEVDGETKRAYRPGSLVTAIESTAYRSADSE